MNRLLLFLSVGAIGLPLSIYVLMTGGHSGAEPKKFLAPDNSAPVIADEGTLPDADKMEKLARDHPVAFLENCVRRYQREVKGYTCTMQKQERIKGKLYPKEIIEVCFREKPFSVLLRWLEGARKAEAALYVAGENQGMMLAHPAGLAGKFVKVVERPVDGDEARESGRYTLDKFGIKNGTLRTLTGWQEAQKRGRLEVEYLGQIKVKEAGDRVCYRLRRKYDKPENDGVSDLTIYVDKDTWLQVGSTLKDKDGNLIAEYFFRDLCLNPEFKNDQFERSALTP